MLRTMTLWNCLGLILLFSLSACGPLQFTVGLGPASERLTKTTVIRENFMGGDRVAIIDVSGVIMNSSPRGILVQGDNPVSVFYEELQEAGSDGSVKAVILRLNTPGGTVTATDAMYRELLRFKQQTGKPVIALMMDVAASGGYYLACGTDHIVAYPSTVTGSIGVILQTISFKPAMDRVGINATAFTSGPNKAAGSPLDELTAEHREILQKMVDDFYVRFREVVRTQRTAIAADVFDRVTDGRVLTGDEALSLGVVDQLGDLHDAFALAKTRAGISRANLIRYHRPREYVGSPYVAAPVPGGQAVPQTQINFAQINLHADAFPSLGGKAGFYYLWQPAVD